MKEQQVEVLVDATKCGGLGEKRKKSVRNTKRYAQLSVESFLRRRLTKPKSLLGLAELRTEVFQFLPRSALDTCLLVGHQWKAEIEDLYLDLALRELKYIRITHVCFAIANVSRVSQELGLSSTFILAGCSEARKESVEHRQKHAAQGHSRGEHARRKHVKEYRTSKSTPGHAK